MAGGGAPGPWPRLRDAWWAFALGLAALALFTAAFLFRLRCRAGGCGGSAVQRLLDLDAVGGLPRLFTTALFVGVAVLAWTARRRCTGRQALWWTAVAGIGVALALAKLLSVHSTLKTDLSPALTPAAGIGSTCVGLGILLLAGRRWAVAAAGPVVLAMALYATAALGLDVVTGIAAAAQEEVGSLTRAATTFVEELGEALTVLLLLVVVRRQAAGAGVSGAAQSVRQQ
jgi:hypothetical protein